ncbi:MULTISPECIES: hypothetical protein [unclassified Streptomyces]|uniref:hypothetical protein n=1 Tax=unclassified Streptomyces TaxID=2593676 RepID=UPI002DDB29F4|nr:MULTISPECIES: hypothetical protein [unclassified Streptomyces]WSB77917.1 hypothetical protein OHB04_20480 [Streptomyces sp. NBC_01775]WSS13826.1 hypothetical protein OG533_19495 [Streptomyces sp. NBC_01186]WSS42651.1 hypothetical protein OG220_20250 [Streptomyces sp. NBC_01187]
MGAGGLNPGMCCRCDLRVTHRALIAIIETGSGPGGSAYACLPCAHDYAKTPLAPAWLSETIAHAEAVRKEWQAQGGDAAEAEEGPLASEDC